MGRREFTMRDYLEIWEHWHAGDSLRALERNLGVDRHTLRKYIALAEAAGYRPGQPGVTRAAWQALYRQTFPQRTPAQPAQTLLAPYQDRIVAGLATNTVTTVWRRLVRDTGCPVSLRTFRRYCTTLAPPPRATDVTVWRPDPPAGEEVPVDYGLMGPWTDPRTHKRQRIWAFCMVWSRSRYQFVWLTPTMDQAAWCAAHVAAFTFFGVVPHRVVLDNLKTGVAQADWYDPQVNRSYAECAAYYGFLVDPARAVHPKDKPRVERPMPYVRDAFWTGEPWLSLAAMNAAAARWCRDEAGQRLHGTTGRQPAVHFAAEEQAAAHALPAEPWELATWTTATVGPDARCPGQRVLYSVPWPQLHRRLDVRVSAREVRFYWQDTCVKIHVRGQRGDPPHDDPADFPPDKVAYYQATPTRCREQAAGLGPHVATVVDALLTPQTSARLRPGLGILRLADTYGAARLDAACHRADAFGDPRYPPSRTILLKAWDRQPLPRPAPAAPAPGALLRGPSPLSTVPPRETP